MIPESDRRERVTSRTYFLSNSLFRGRVLCRSSAFRFFSLRLSTAFLVSSPSTVLRARPVLGLLSSRLSRALRRNRSYCSRRRSRCLFLSPAMPLRSRSEKPDSIFICGMVHNKTPPFPRGSKIADRRFRS